MDAAVKRLALVAFVVLAVASTTSAHAQVATEETPQGTFSSPTRAVAGAPVVVRSITPCPMTAGAYQYARVFIRPQTQPSSTGEIDATFTDLRADGSWELVLAAPVDMPEGVTKSYSVHAQCVEDEFQYANPPRGATTSSTLVPVFSYFRYFLRPLYVTGYGPSDVVEGDGPSGTAPPATAAATTTSVTSGASAGSALSSAGRVKGVRSAPSTTSEPTTSTYLDDSAERIAEAREELAARGIDDTEMTDREVLLASATGTPGRPVAPVDGGIPWWAFGLAAILAVSAVVAFGARRTSALSQLDG